jgi:hypothetical protein
LMRLLCLYLAVSSDMVLIFWILKVAYATSLMKHDRLMASHKSVVCDDSNSKIDRTQI